MVLKEKPTFVLIIFLFLISIILTNCSNNDKRGSNISRHKFPIIIDIEIMNDTSSFEDLIDSFKIVKLETNESLFGDITNLYFINKSIIIFDKTNQKVLVFDLDGNFIKKIGRIGNGPGEYMNIRCVSVDNDKQHILLLDDKKLEIHHYNMEGNFVFSEEFEIFPHDFISANDNVIFFLNSSPYYFGENIFYDLLITENRKIVNKKFPFSRENKFIYPLNRVFYELNDTVCFIEKWSSKAYSIVEEKIVPRFFIDFSNVALPAEFVTDEKLFDLNSDDYGYLFDYVLETNTFIYFQYMYKGNLMRKLYNKVHNQYHTFTNVEDRKDIFSLSFAPISTYNDFFISVIPPHLLIEARKKNFLNQTQIKLTDSLEYSDNAILMFHKLKRNIQN